MKIAIASDHAGYKLKEEIKKHIASIYNDVEIHDCGTTNTNKTDYPLFGALAAKKLSLNKVDWAIVICGSGVGMSIVANRFKKVRCVNGTNLKLIEASRKHNNINCLALGERFLKKKEALKYVEIFLKTKFEKGRHVRRIDLIEKVGDK